MSDQTTGTTLRFSEDCSSAITPAGKKIPFTSLESKALRFFIKNPDRLVTRAHLLDVVSEEGSDKNDRNVDFLINRIRKKLNDSAKNPNYIATRYGEGYIWVGGTQSTSVASNDAYLVIGPVRVTNQLRNITDLAQPVGQAMQKALSHRLPGDHRVVFDPDCPDASEFTQKTPEIGAELTFFTDSDLVECIVTVRIFRTGRILAMTRISVSDGSKGTQPGERDPGKLADWILQEIWRARAKVNYSGDPLPVAIHTASKTKETDEADSPQNKPAEGARVWKKNDSWMRKLIAERPDDPEIQLNYATHLHSKYVVSGIQLFQKGIDERILDEAEIERLVQTALPSIQTNPDMAIMAAKLLFFLDRGYSNFAIDLAEQAQKESTSITHTMPIIGQLRGFLGNFSQGVSALDQAISLAEKGTSTHLYALVMKCNLHLAAGNGDALTETKQEIYSLRPALKFFLEPFYTDPREPSLSARASIMMLTRNTAAARLLYCNYVLCRLFQSQLHRENAIRPILFLTIRRFDSKAIPTEIAVAYPDLMRSYNHDAYG